MVRVGGLSYTCTPAEAIGRRISELKLDSGHPLEAGRNYKVAGWASVNEQQGIPVWDVFASHLRSGKALARLHPGGTFRAVDNTSGTPRPSSPPFPHTDCRWSTPF